MRRFRMCAALTVPNATNLSESRPCNSQSAFRLQSLNMCNSVVYRGCVDNMRVQQWQIRRIALLYSLPGDCSSAISVIRMSLSARNPLATWCGSSRSLAAYLSARYSNCRRAHAKTTRPTSTALPTIRNSIQWCRTKYRKRGETELSALPSQSGRQLHGFRRRAPAHELQSWRCIRRQVLQTSAH